jgi:hypothetical protein
MTMMIKNFRLPFFSSQHRLETMLVQQHDSEESLSATIVSGTQRRFVLAKILTLSKSNRIEGVFTLDLPNVAISVNFFCHR